MSGRATDTTAGVEDVVVGADARGLRQGGRRHGAQRVELLQHGEIVGADVLGIFARGGQGGEDPGQDVPRAVHPLHVALRHGHRIRDGSGRRLAQRSFSAAAAYRFADASERDPAGSSTTKAVLPGNAWFSQDVTLPGYRCSCWVGSPTIPA